MVYRVLLSCCVVRHCLEKLFARRLANLNPFRVVDCWIKAIRILPTQPIGDKLWLYNGFKLCESNVWIVCQDMNLFAHFFGQQCLDNINDDFGSSRDIGNQYEPQSIREVILQHGNTLFHIGDRRERSPLIAGGINYDIEFPDTSMRVGQGLGDGQIRRMNDSANPGQGILGLVHARPTPQHGMATIDIFGRRGGG